MGSSHKTSDFIADCIESWWNSNKDKHSSIKELVINSDNGPETNGRRSQFLQRMVNFADSTGLRIHLAYYPPYHSKYNPIERCWAILENHWNGTLLSNVEIVLQWAKTMTWKGISPIVELSTRIYRKGVSLTKQAMLQLKKRLCRSKTLPKWDIVIEPQILV